MTGAGGVVPDSIGTLPVTGRCRGAICYRPATRWVIVGGRLLIEMCDRHADETENADA